MLYMFNYFQKEIPEVQQVDLVPTLSLLLGLPIPFSNLGTVITDLFNHCPWWKTDENQVKQVQYLFLYNQKAPSQGAEIAQI